jgi:quinohemoprotein ethanol dehydrogenase
MWDAIVLGGLHWQYGMVGFGGELSKEQSDAVHAYVIERAHFTVDGQKAAAAAGAPGSGG